jgi:hypothetical protein
MKRTLTALLLAAMPLLAAAERYRVDVALFLNPADTTESPAAPRHPDDVLAISLDDPAGLKAAGIEVLPEAGSLLGPEWMLLKNNHRYKPLLQLSWTQERAAAKGGPAVRVFLPSGDGVTNLDGWLRLNAMGYPVLSADLEYTQLSMGLPAGYRLREVRKVNAGALQYFDSARLGMLAKVTVLP